MKPKMIGLALVGIMIAAMITMAVPVSADTWHTSMYTGQTKTFSLQKGDTYEVSYYPNEVGYKVLNMYHTSWMDYSAHAWATLYWTENGGITWHQFEEEPIIYWLEHRVGLYNGVPNIGYKAVIHIPDYYPDVYALWINLRADG